MNTAPRDWWPEDWWFVSRARDMAMQDAFTERLRSAVTQCGGATYVAQHSGVPLSTLNNYLAGRSEPKRLALAALARVLRRDLGWLLTGDGPPSPAAAGSIARAEPRADVELLHAITEAMLALYAELGHRPVQSGFGRKCAQIHNAIAATAHDDPERHRMLALALALHRQELAGTNPDIS